MQKETVKRKYSYFDKLDPIYVSDYLREAIQNTNYEDLTIKYAPGASIDVLTRINTPLNEIAADLTVKYREKLSIEEQSILVLYNNDKYRKLCDEILAIYDRDTLTSKEIVLFVDFNFSKGNITEIENVANLYASIRKSRQPKGYSAGSVFKNPKNYFAGKLIESLSLKGYRVGGAYVSNEHANFIINDGTASSLDIYLLKNKIQEKVFKEYGINLETEIEFVGEF